MARSVQTHEFAYSLPVTGENCPPFRAALCDRYKCGSLTAAETLAAATTLQSSLQAVRCDLDVTTCRDC